jgi:hypothetical protein
MLDAVDNGVNADKMGAENGRVTYRESAFS